MWFHDRPEHLISVKGCMVQRSCPSRNDQFSRQALWRAVSVPFQRFAEVDPYKPALSSVSLISSSQGGRILQELRSLVFKDVAFATVCEYRSRAGSAQSCRLRMRPGINDIKANCIMHKRSQRDPKKSIWFGQVEQPRKGSALYFWL